jgi:hypothetical protein
VCQDLVGRQLEIGQGLQRGAHAPHDDRFWQPVPHDVADDEGNPVG